MGTKKLLRKRGWNWESFWKSILWYYQRGMKGKASIMLLITVCTLGIGLLPVMIYCGAKGNSDFYWYIKRDSIII